MKGTKFMGAIAAAMLVISQSLGAQPQGPWGGGAMRMAGMRTPQERAEAQAKQLQKQLILTDKQYKKVYSLCYKEANLRQSLMQEKLFGSSGVQGGFSGGMGGPGMGSRGDFKMPSDTSEMRKMMNRIDVEDERAMVKFQRKKETKMSKILTASQFERWQEINKHQNRDRMNGMMNERMQRNFEENDRDGRPGDNHGQNPQRYPRF